jgi:hypothetical protein
MVNPWGDKVSGLVKIGVLLNVAGSLFAILGLAYAWPAWATLVGVWATVWCAASLFGAWQLQRDQVKLGVRLLFVAGLALLPFGGVSMLAAHQTWTRFRIGLLLRRRGEQEKRPRPRQWLIASVLCGLVSIAAAAFALHQLYSARLVDISSAIAILSALLLAVLAGVLALLFFDHSPAAPRLGFALGFFGLLGCALGAFYLHSYLALALLGVPAYLLLLLYLGRDKDRSVSKGKSPLSGSGGLARAR